ncbi:MAG: AMP-binding protein [Bacteroidales bacterium]|nr:AMP-binding protein [Bacteroidales bacterium]
MEFRSVNKILEKSFRENWDRPALSNYKGDTLKYSDVATLVMKIQLCFRECGVQRGDKVALCSRNQANWGVSFLAALTYGAVPVPLLHEFKSENIHYLVNHSEAKVLFVDDYIWEGLSESEMPGVHVVVQMGNFKPFFTRAREYSEAIESLPEKVAEAWPSGFGPDDIDYYTDSPDELAMINYTSGTSGFSKGVMIPYRALWCNIRFAHETAEPQMDCNSQVVAMLPSAHMYGMSFEFLFEMTIGAHVHFLNRAPSPKVIMQAFSEVHPDIIVAVPLIIEKVYRSQIKPIVDRNRTWLRIPFVDQFVLGRIREGMVKAFGESFEEVILGGAPFNPEVEQFLWRVRFPFTVCYGMTECAPIITYAHWNKTKKGSCGVPIPGCVIRIDSPNPCKIPGEVQVKGDNVFLGYYKNRQATRSAFTNDGWFKTGDMGVIDSGGYLYLRGRSKCMILGPSGQNIYPEELEAVVNNVSYVVDSLVIEDNGGLTALIYPDYRQAQIDGFDNEALQQKILSDLPEINRQLPGYAQIRKIEFMPEDFERTPKRSIKRYLYQR